MVSLSARALRLVRDILDLVPYFVILGYAFYILLKVAGLAPSPLE